MLLGYSGLSQLEKQLLAATILGALRKQKLETTPSLHVKNTYLLIWELQPEE